MNALPKEKWAKILVISAFVILAGVGIYLFLRKILPLFLPFIIAFIIGRLMQSPINRLRKRLKWPVPCLGFILTAVIISFLGFVVFLLINQLIAEAQRLFERLSENSELILSSASAFLDEAGKKLPFIYDYMDRDVIYGTVSEVIKNTLTALTSQLAGILTAFVKGIPDIGLFFVVLVIASFYFAMDYNRIAATISSLLPHKMKGTLASAMSSLKNTCIGYIKAYSVILLITFAQLFVGFLILKVNYATTLALIIALLDMLPVIGTGTVLVPWGIFNLVMGRYGMGIGILVLFGVISIVREVIEPKIIGSSIGMHPLLTLIAMYVGYKLFGLWGILLLPPAAVPLRSFVWGMQKQKTHH